MDTEASLKKKQEEQGKEAWGCDPWNAKYCRKCRLQHGEPPWADLPEKSHCLVYRHEDGLSKPYDVVHFGAECEFFEEE